MTTTVVVLLYFVFVAQVHDVMGLSLREEASVFQLECDRSRVRFGVITLAFHFDPPVSAAVLGELSGAVGTLPASTMMPTATAVVSVCVCVCMRVWVLSYK